MARKLGLGLGLMAVLALAGARLAAADPMTWTGKISDAMCAPSGKHASGDGTMAGDHKCAIDCVKGGSTYVFIVTGADKKTTIYKIANQKLADLEAHAGHTVEITGEMKDDTITVSKVKMLPVPK